MPDIQNEAVTDGEMSGYGYACMTENTSVDPSTSTRINGFADGTAADGSDKYFSYDITLSKTVEKLLRKGQSRFPVYTEFLQIWAMYFFLHS